MDDLPPQKHTKLVEPKTNKPKPIVNKEKEHIDELMTEEFIKRYFNNKKNEKIKLI